ncbi:hypothetical protein [Streptomyces cyanogenus]|uniref:hypothetical protein n=1 Tax=Streptomyces cyanogenus TaxID=80860 RepID=UPI001AA0BD40|nr:hypothetical protein [Streptomyces cyanogenus]
MRWLQGGRGGAWETEKFGDPVAAEEFKKLVDAHGQQRPPGWVTQPAAAPPVGADTAAAAPV